MQFAGTSWHELNYIRQAVGFLVCIVLHFLAMLILVVVDIGTNTFCY